MNKTVSFVGSGKIVHSFIPALTKAGFNIDSIIGTNISELDSLSTDYNIKVCTQDLTNLNNRNYIFLAVPDSEIKTVAAKIADLNTDFEDTVFIHLSGSKTVAELACLSKRGFSVASLHPMQTFPSYSAIDLTDVYTAIETNDDKVFNELSELALELKMKPFRIKTKEKTAYHLMGVFVSNFMTANFYNADQAVKKSKGIPDSQELLKTIAVRTLENILDHGPVNSLSGPIERGDTETIKIHLQELENNPELLNHYIASSLTLCKIALEKKSISLEKYKELCKVLNNH